MEVVINNIQFKYKRNSIIFNKLNLKLSLGDNVRGRCVAIVGHNGAGKTTLLNIICSILKVQSGDVEINNINSISYLPFDNPVYGNLTVYNNLLFWYQLKHNKPFNILDPDVEMIINRLNIKSLLDFKVKILSSGEAKKVALACLLLQNSDLLVLDEPFNGVDPVTVNEILKIIEIYQDEGKSFIITSHQLSILESVCNQVVIIKEGSIVFNEDMSNISESLNDLYLKYHYEN